MTVQTPWEAGRFDRRTGPMRVLFGRMYEDPSIEASVFPEGSRVFCIASAGCTAMALAGRHRVTAVDINPVQLEYARRRRDGAPVETGTAEQVMNALRTLLPLAGWSRGVLSEFLSLDDAAEQIAFWRRRLDTRLFRAGIDVCLSVRGLSTVYASPFLSILPEHFGRVMRGRMERCFGTHPNRTNPYARALLLGETAAAPRDPHADLRLVEADAASYLEACSPGSFDGFTLSNILDGAPPGYEARLFAAVRRAAAPDAHVVLRSFAEPRRTRGIDLAASDRSFLWGVVEVHRARDL